MNAAIAAARTDYQGMELSSSPRVIVLTQGWLRVLAASSAAGIGNPCQLLGSVKQGQKH